MRWFERLASLFWIVSLLDGAVSWFDGNYQEAQVAFLCSISLAFVLLFSALASLRKVT